MNNNKKLFLAISPLLLMLFIDGFGQGVIFPILVKSLTDLQSTVLVTTESATIRNVLYGIVVGIYFFCWFFGVPVLSDLSDRIGRKKTLIVCLIGTFLGYFLSILAFMVHSVTLLIIGRVVDGLTAASQPVAQAAIVDLSDEQDKTRNLGYVLLALSLGIIAGPFVGGFLSDKHLVSWFAIDTPFYFALLLSLINIAFLLALFKETHEVKVKTKIHLSRAIQVFTSAFTHRNIRYISVCFLLAQSGFAFFYFYITDFLALKFHYGGNEVAVVFTILALGFCIGFGYLVKILQKKLSLKQIILLGYLMLSLLNLIILITQSALAVWLLVFFIGAFLAAGYTCYMGLFSNQVDASQQGWVMGVTGAVNAISGGVCSILVGILSNINYDLPILMTVILAFASSFLLYFFKSSS